MMKQYPMNQNVDVSVMSIFILLSACGSEDDPSTSPRSISVTPAVGTSTAATAAQTSSEKQDNNSGTSSNSSDPAKSSLEDIFKVTKTGEVELNTSLDVKGGVKITEEADEVSGFLYTMKSDEAAFDREFVITMKDGVKEDDKNRRSIFIGPDVAGGTGRIQLDARTVGIQVANPTKTLEVGGNGAAFLGNNLYIHNPKSPPNHKTWGFVVGEEAGNFTIGSATDAIPGGGSLSGGAFIRMNKGATAAGDSTQIRNYVALSDRNAKANIQPLHHALARLNALQGVSFYWKDRPSSRREFGMIAQDVEKVLPEVVYTNSDGQKSVAYIQLIAFLIESVKEQQKTIDHLQGQVEKLLGRKNRVTCSTCE